MNLGGAFPLQILDWGRIPYADAWAQQKELLFARQSDRIPDTLVFCEHEPVITLGRESQRDERPAIHMPGVPVFEIERGGHATYHGPGQLVAYPIFKLDREKGPRGRNGVSNLVHAMEDWVIATLAGHGLVSVAGGKGRTGVWVGNERKVASIGIAVSRWVSYHGLSLNFATGPSPWLQFNPCGFDGQVMTDLTRELGRPVSYAETRDALLERLVSVFPLNSESSAPQAVTF